MSTTAATSTNILGPLTTTFTQPSSCTNLLSQAVDVAVQDQYCNGDNIRYDTACWPPVTAGADTSPQALSTWGVYSPGLVCPSGLTPACSYDGSLSTGDYQFYYPPGPSETAIGCCPSGYFCQGGPHCKLLVTSATVPTVSCSASSSVVTYLSVPYTVTNASSVETISTFTAKAPMLQMLYGASDVASNATSSGSTATSSSSAGNQGSNEGLSVGADVGIAIGVAVLVIAVACAAVFIWRRKRRQAPKPPEEVGLQPKATEATELYSMSAPQELSNSPVDYYGQRAPVELQ